MVFEEIINQDFKSEKRIDFTVKYKQGEEEKTADLYFTVKKIPLFQREKIIDSYVKRVKTSVNKQTGQEEFIAVDNYSEIKKEQFDIMFDYGLQKNNQNLCNGDLTKDFIEKIGLSRPDVLERIKEEILVFNGLIEKK